MILDCIYLNKNMRNILSLKIHENYENYRKIL